MGSSCATIGCCPLNSFPATVPRPMIVFRYFVLAYCAWQSVDLLGTWWRGSTESWGWLMFGLWLVPALAATIRGTTDDRPQVGLLAAAVVATLVGQMTWLNVLQHVGLALAIVGWRQPVRGQWVWLASSLLWMPACGWLAAGTATGWEAGLRLAGVAAVAVGLVAWPRRGCNVATTLLAIGLASFGAPVHAETFTYSKIQSDARPFGLDVVDLVGERGTDTASAEFLNDALPTMQSLVGADLSGITVGSQVNGFTAIDPASLKLVAAADVRVYFVGEATGYHNSLGFNTGGGGVDTGDPLLIFPDATVNPTYGINDNAKRTKTFPLFPGDFVQLGSMDAGTELDFFLVSRGDTNQEQLFSTDPSVNPDGTSRAVAFAQANSPYVLVSFEDLAGSGQRNYSDVVFAVYVGEQNVAAMLGSPTFSPGLPAPEPGFIWVLVTACGGWLYRARRKRAAA